MESAMVLAQGRGHVRIYFAAALACSALGCGGRDLDAFSTQGSVDAGTPRVSVGEVTGTDVRVAVVATDHRARIFFCGGDSSYATATRWLVVDIDSFQRVVLPPSVDQPWRLDAEVQPERIAGTFDMGDAVSHVFEATAVAPGTIAGLYEALAPCGRVGLIVAQPSLDAEPIGQGSCVGPSPAPIVQVTPVRPIARGADGAIPVLTPGAINQTFVRSAAPPPD
jgi:hypothetical protein